MRKIFLAMISVLVFGVLLCGCSSHTADADQTSEIVSVEETDAEKANIPAQMSDIQWEETEIAEESMESNTDSTEDIETEK